MNVLAWSKHLTRERCEAAGAELAASLDDVLRTSDVVTIHLVLSERTRGLIGARELGLMKQTAYLINTSRGPIVDERALIAALKKDKIAGAGLDVFDEEPLPAAHPFRTLENVVATPHLGYVSEDTYRIFYGQALEDIVAWLAGSRCGCSIRRSDATATAARLPGSSPRPSRRSCRSARWCCRT